MGLLLIHWLHVLCGVLWAGAQLFNALVLWPTLLRVPGAQARAFIEASVAYAAPVMGTSGMLVLVLGILRGTWFGPIRSFDAIVATRYGMLFATAIVLSIFVTIYGGWVRGQLDKRVFDGDAYRPGAQSFVRTTSAVIIVALVVVVFCMARMRLG
jgi:uncharacterized membrane protein